MRLIYANASDLLESPPLDIILKKEQRNTFTKTSGELPRLF